MTQERRPAGIRAASDGRSPLQEVVPAASVPTQVGRRRSIAAGLAGAPSHVHDAIDGAHVTGFGYGYARGWWDGYDAREAELVAKDGHLRERLRTSAGLPSHRALVAAREAAPDRSDVGWRCASRAELVDACSRDWDLT